MCYCYFYCYCYLVTSKRIYPGYVVSRSPVLYSTNTIYVPLVVYKSKIALIMCNFKVEMHRLLSCPSGEYLFLPTGCRHSHQQHSTTSEYCVDLGPHALFLHYNVCCIETVFLTRARACCRYFEVQIAVSALSCQQGSRATVLDFGPTDPRTLDRA
jgi:hypothetical protein